MMPIAQRLRWPVSLPFLAALLIAPAPSLGTDDPIHQALSAVVHIRAQIPPSARTARFLGTQREASGIVIDAEGLVLTVGYILLEAEQVAVTSLNGRPVRATVIGNDYDTGFGLVRASHPLPVPPIPLGLSAELAERAEVLVASYGAAEAVLPVLVTARQEFTGYWEYLLEDAIFTSPPHPNFAGAALIGPSGHLLGIGSLFVGNAFQGGPGERRLPGNMFIPIDRLKPILPDLLATGRTSKPPRPWLGLFTEEVGGHLFISGTIPEGPSAQAGLRAGDIIVGVGDKTVSDQAEFYRAVWARGEAGVEVPLQILRQSAIQTLSVRSLDRDRYFQHNQDRHGPGPDTAQSAKVQAGPWPELLLRPWSG